MTNNYQSSKYIVDADGTTPFTTIQSAINQADTDGVPALGVSIEIRPGEYTEDLVLISNINLIGCSEAVGTGTTAIYQVVINGTHTPPAAGQIAFSNIKFTSNTSVLVDAAANTCNIGFYKCVFACLNGYICDMTAATGDITIQSCSDVSTRNGIVLNDAGGSAVDIIDSKLGADSANSLTVSGPTRIFSSRIFCPTILLGALPAPAASALIQDSTIDAILTVADDAQCQIYNSYLNSAVACLEALSSQRVIIGNVVFNSPAANVITGTGTVEIGEAVFLDAFSIAGTVTVNRVNECAAGNLRSYGNLDLPATEDLAGGGIINIDGDRHIHAMGTHNSFVGQEAGNLLLTVATATDSSALGFEALHDLTSGAYSTAVGSLSLTKLTTGTDNTACGADTLSALLTGDKNIALGSTAGNAFVAAESSNIVIGNTGTIGDSNTIRIGDNGVGLGQQDKAYMAGVYQATSGATKEVVYIDSNHKLSSSNLGITQWVTATASLSAAVNTGYLVKMAIPGLCTITLPAVSAVGDVIEITGYTVGGWLIAQNALQQINFIAASTTLGVGGSLASTQRYDSIKLVCATANTDWNVLSSSGNITIV